MKEFLTITAALSLIPLACSTIPPKSARTNPIYYPQEIRPPTTFRPIPAVKPTPKPVSTQVAKHYYDFEVWWNPNMWPGDPQEWYMVDDHRPVPNSASFIHEDCIYYLKAVSTWRLRPGLGDAPDITLVAEFLRQENILAHRGSSQQVKFTPVRNLGTAQAGFNSRIGNAYEERSIIVEDYTVSLGAVADVSSACLPGSPDVRKQRGKTLKTIADSITFVRR